MEQLHWKAYGKINIGLDITGKREDGYHLLKTVMQTVDVYDEITFSVRKKGIMLNTDRPFVPDDERNLAFKAAKLVSDTYKLKKGILIDIKKHIPVGGGMAGGSTDAACTISAMNKLFSLGMTREDKIALAASIGADVPFCLKRGAYLAEGIGEKLTKLSPLPPFYAVICAPPFSVSTKWAYEAFDREKEPFHPDMARLLDAMKENRQQDFILAMGNSLEPVVEKKYPDIKVLREKLAEAGAMKAMMSGSGSTVFGLFDKREQAEEAGNSIKTAFKKTEIFVTTFITGE